MKLSQFKSLIREEVKKVLNEDYIRKMNLYTDEFDQLSSQDYNKLSKLIQHLDKVGDTNKKFDTVVMNISSYGDFDDASSMLDYYYELAKKAKSLFPNEAKMASEIVKILEPIA